MMLRGRVFRVTPALIRDLTQTLEVLDSQYPWTTKETPSHSQIIECLETRQFEAYTLYLIGTLLTDIRLIYRVVAASLHLISSINPIALERVYFLYTSLQHIPINFAPPTPLESCGTFIEE
jgi:hypothetical protein